MADERERRLLEEQISVREAELEALQELSQEAGFAPRRSIARTPPLVSGSPPVLVPAASTTTQRRPNLPAQMSEPARPQPPSPPPTVPPSSSKRHLSSPEEVQEAVRRKMASKSQTPAPPLGGILRGGTQAIPMELQQVTTPASTNPASSDSLSGMTKVQLIDGVHKSIKGIIAVTSQHNKLNIADKTTISNHGVDILAIVAALELKLGESEAEVSALKLQCTSLELQMARAPAQTASPLVDAPPLPRYANALKLPKGKPPIEVQPKGPAVLFYPNTDSSLKSSMETKLELQKAIQPSTAGIRIQSVRMIGNSGVVVRTATAEAAQKLRAAAPPSLKVAEPRSRLPRVALRFLRTDYSADELLEQLYSVNLSDDPDWSMEKLKDSCKLAYKRSYGVKVLVVLECSANLRDKLIRLGRVYIGWDEAEVCDHVRATCCTKCHQYGHPEKYCKATTMTCGKCGDSGHRSAECQSTTQCCATCKRFKRKEASSHSTAAANCPARLHAEQQSLNMIQYG